MSFSYQPLTDEEIEKERQFPMLEPGIYDFEVKSAKFKMSNSGPNRNPEKPSNPMIELILLIWDKTGKEFNIYDYLVSTPKMIWKSKHFCDATGLVEEYKNGQFNEHLCEGRRGKAQVVYQPGGKKEGGGYHKDKNAIEDYLSNDTKLEVGKGHEVPVAELNDDIPF